MTEAFTQTVGEEMARASKKGVPTETLLQEALNALLRMSRRSRGNFISPETAAPTYSRRELTDCTWRSRRRFAELWRGKSGRWRGKNATRLRRPRVSRHLTGGMAHNPQPGRRGVMSTPPHQSNPKLTSPNRPRLSRHSIMWPNSWPSGTVSRRKGSWRCFGRVKGGSHGARSIVWRCNECGTSTTRCKHRGGRYA